MTDPELEICRLRTALGLFSSCIKCGESWSPLCDKVMGLARDALNSLESSRENPFAYGVWCPKGAEFDYVLLYDEIEAYNAAMELWPDDENSESQVFSLFRQAMESKCEDLNERDETCPTCGHVYRVYDNPNTKINPCLIASVDPAPSATSGKATSEPEEAYFDRNQLVQLFAMMAQELSWGYGVKSHGSYQIVYVDSPEGQLSWHIPDNEIDVDAWPEYKGEWDNSPVAEKRVRMRKLIDSYLGASRL